MTTLLVVLIISVAMLFSFVIGFVTSFVLVLKSIEDDYYDIDYKRGHWIINEVEDA